MRILLLFLIAPFFIPQAWAGSNTPQPQPEAVVKGDFSLMKNTGGGRVNKIIDASTILLKDGKIIRLMGIDYPYDQNGVLSEEVLSAKDRLEKILPEGSEVVLWQSRNLKSERVNRMGHVLAHLEMKKDGRWINGTLVGEGLAWVMTDYMTPDMADQLYALENKARVKKIGIWRKESVYGLLSPETAKKGNGTYRVVEGVVTRAASSKNNLYLNFGHDMKTDFTVMISAGMRKVFSKRGLDVMALQGRTVRVRGWIREWNGPFMELESAERLEILPPLPTIESTQDFPVKLPAANLKAGQVNP